MRINLVLAPAEEPVSVADAEAWLRFSDRDGADPGVVADRAILAGLIASARSAAETRLNRAIVTQTWEATWDRWPWISPTRDVRSLPRPREIRLPYPALQSVTSIRYVDATGTTQVLAPSTYLVSAGTPGRVSLAPGADWPETQPRADAITVRYVAGYGTSASVPDVVKTAVKMLTAMYYEAREEPGAMPPGISALLDSEDWGSRR